MPRNSSGTYALPAGNPVVTNTLIQSTWANTTLSDVSTAMTDSLDRNGRGAMLAPLKNVDGTAVAPSYTFSSEGTLGIYRAAAGVLGFAVGGALVLSLASTGLTFTTPLVLPIGSVTAPSLTFAANTNTGLYSPATNQVALTAGGVQGLLLTPALMTVTATAVASGAVALNLNNAQSGQGVSLNVTGTTFAAGGVGASTALLAPNAANTNLAIGNVSAGTGFIQFVLNNAERLRIDPAGNVGFGVAPAAWAGGLKAIEGSAGALAFSGTGSAYVTQNLYYNGSAWIFRNAGFGGVITLNGGGFQFYTGGTGAAGGTSTLNASMQLDSNGNMMVGTATSPYASAGRKVLSLQGSADSLLAFQGGGDYLWSDTSGNKLELAAAGASRGIAFVTNGAQRLTITAAGNVQASGVISQGSGVWNTYGYGFTTNAGYVQVSPGSAAATSGGFWTTVDNSTYRGGAMQLGSAYSLDFYVGNGSSGWVKQLSLTQGGLITDGAGIELGWKGLPQTLQGSAYILTANDRGRQVYMTANGATVPAGVFSTGDVITILNGTAGSITITQGSGTSLYQCGTANIGSRTLLVHGICTLVCISANSFFISGNIT